MDQLRDYPRRLRGRERATIAETAPISATFELAEDLAAVQERFGPDVPAGRELTVERTYAGGQRLLAQPDGAELTGEPAALLRERLPRFLYFDGYSLLPGRVSIPRPQSTPEAELDPGERTALALLRLAGVDAAEFADAEYEARRAALETAAIAISEEVFRY